MDERPLKKIIAERFGDSWNHQHTQAAVYYMKQLLKTESGDPRILLTAIYLHDIGYIGTLSLADRVAQKQSHMQRGAELVPALLAGLSYSDEEIARITQLVRTHDHLDGPKTKEETMIIEADSLAAIDHQRVPSSFTPEELETYWKRFHTHRAPLFRTPTGKKLLNRLLQKPL